MITHHFCDGVYAKETRIPKGMTLGQHAHPYDHVSILAAGAVLVADSQGADYYEAPTLLTIKAGRQHEVTALSDVVWYCIHATDETDPAKVDQVILEG